jgi:hypothetical protein
MFMKLFISILLAFTCHASFANEHHETAGNEVGGKQEKDWNEVFKQPVSNPDVVQVPEATQILEPTFLSHVKGEEVTLKWKPVTGVKYHLQVSKSATFANKWLIVNEELVNYTEYALKNLEPNQQYFWRVFTKKPENARSYTTGPAVNSEFETL